MSKFRVCIAGGRDFNDQGLLFNKCDQLLQNKHPDIIIVSGVAWGADAAGINYAKARGHEIDAFPVLSDQWKIGKWMGHRRNEVMLDTCHALIAFWDGKSSGTNGAIQYGQKKGIPVRVIYYKGNGQLYIKPDAFYKSEPFRKQYT